MRDMGGIPHQQLQRMPARRQGKLGFSFALMSVLLICGYGQVQGWQFDINKQMMMPRIIRIDPGRGYAHIFHSEFDDNRVGYGFPFSRGQEIDHCIVCCRGAYKDICRQENRAGEYR